MIKFIFSLSLILYSQFTLSQSVELDKKFISDSATFVFNGEVHGDKVNPEIKSAILKNLIRYNGFNILVVEYGYAYSFILNNYFSGNLSDKSIVSEQLFSKQELQFYKSIKDYSDSIYSKKPFIFLGIDYEKNISCSFFALQLFIKQNGNENAISKNELLKSVCKANYLFPSEEEIHNLILLKKSILSQDSIIYHSLFTNHYNDFAQILNAIKLNFFHHNFNKSARKHEVDSLMNERDSFIADNLLRFYSNNRDNKFFGQFGLLHVSLIKGTEWLEVEKWNSFVSIMNSKYPQKIVSIPILYDYFSLFENRFFKKSTNKYIGISKDTLKKIKSVFPKKKICLFDPMSLQIETKNYQYLIYYSYR